jgi:hypothetical protein
MESGALAARVLKVWLQNLPISNPSPISVRHRRYLGVGVGIGYRFMREWLELFLVVPPSLPSNLTGNRSHSLSSKRQGYPFMGFWMDPFMGLVQAPACGHLAFVEFGVGGAKSSSVDRPAPGVAHFSSKLTMGWPGKVNLRPRVLSIEIAGRLAGESLSGFTL